jgi:hypothetical protein
MLTTDNLKYALRMLSKSTYHDDVVEILEEELERRKYGPFTLAEAVASGRPFKRSGWQYWCRKAASMRDADEPSFEFLQAFDKWEPAPAVCDSHGFPVAEEWLSVDDIVECDYEIKAGDDE